MFQFIIALRTVACLLITNSHQEDIYPIRILASGGLLGDVIYFAISGYLLYTLAEQRFGTWYFKRLKRIYPAVWLTAGTLILGNIYGDIPPKRVLELMFYPTHYHFVASILVMYVFFFAFLKLMGRYKEQQDRCMAWVAMGVVAVYLIAFYTAFDRSYYHIDDVNSKMIWPLFFLSMLVGAYFRVHAREYINKGGFLPWVATALASVVYFGTKFTASRGIMPASVQWINQFTLLILLFCIFRCFIGVEDKITALPKSVMTPIAFISSMAFELYLTQAIIIPTYNTGIETFPHNFIITMSITFLFAWLVHTAVEIILEFAGKLSRKGAVKA